MKPAPLSSIAVSSAMITDRIDQLTRVIGLLGFNDQIPDFSVLLASDDDHSVLLHVE